ncbi:MAG TPA: hypothetical protein VEO54_19505 [Thermoanaerobaculia bacterium]|nr:hypothetical protein [Thermoanaerobaculia bacterium]
MYRFLVPLLIGVLAALAAAVMPHPVRLGGVEVGDIGLPLAGIAQFEGGGSPYDIRLRGHTPALYPFTTMLALWPLKLVPLRFAVPLFVGLSSFALAFAVARNGKPWQLLLFLTPSYWSAVQSVQWSPLLTAAILLPPLLPLAVVKPQLGVVLAASGQWSRKTLLATLALVAASLLVWPAWPMEWLRHGNLRTFNGFSPVAVLPGIVLLFGALAWRTREGRLLLAMSAVVQRYFYDQLPLYLVAKTWRQMLLLLASSWVPVLLFRPDTMSGVQQVEVWRGVIVLLYLPALGIVLFNRRADQIDSRNSTSLPNPSGQREAMTR